MTTKLRSWTEYLEEAEVPFERLIHRTDYTAQETAHDTHTPGSAFAKTVVLELGDDRLAMAVLPAPDLVDLDKVRAATGADEVRLAGEEAIERLCPDCETGAVPPFGGEYGIPIFVSEAFAGQEWITFNAGRHDLAIRMRFRDWLDLARPTFVDLSTPTTAGP